MKTLLCTKLFRGLDFAEIARITGDLGFEGVDLLIRDGHQLQPDAPERIGDAVRGLRADGLAVPLATTDLTDPDQPGAERLLGCCADAGIGQVRLGFWKYRPDLGYRACLDGARRNLDGLVLLARRIGLKLVIQLHGRSIHASGAQTLVLLQDHDPALLGAYPDPGNQAVQDGREDWRFTFDALNPWLCCIGVKNGGWFPAELGPGGQRHWRCDWLGLADGMVPWDEIFPFLAGTGYAGLLSFHSHYRMPLTPALDQTRFDLQTARRLMAAGDRSSSSR